MACAVACGVLVFAGLALGASSYTDATGDDNAAPDVRSVTVSKGADGMLTIAISVGNFQSLPTDSWFNLWFDLDSDQDTGDEGDEALVRYHASGAIDFLLWNGADLVERPSTAMTGTYAGGILTVTSPESAFGGLTSFGFLAVSARAQPFGDTEFIASDFAPDSGRSAFVGSAQVVFPDRGGDHDAAPDIASVRVTDAKNGWISFAIQTPNYATLPVESVLVVLIDRDNRANTGDEGADLLVRSVGGEVVLERWAPARRDFVADERPTRARVRNAGNVVTIDVHRSELGSAPRFGFALAAIDYNVQADLVLGVDFAPEGGKFFRYTMANKAVLALRAGRLFATPAQPRAGKPFAVSLPVTRSDTNRGITSGRVTCTAALGGRTLRAKGSVARGTARCGFGIPRTAVGQRLRGTVAVRVDGKSVAAQFAYVVR